MAFKFKYTIGLHRAIKIFGSEKKLADQLHISKHTVNRWKNLVSVMPYDKAVMIYTLTKGKVLVEDLRPDLANLTKQFFLQYANHQAKQPISKQQTKIDFNFLSEK